MGPQMNTALLRDQRGATLTEFGFVAPVLILMVMGIFDMAHTQYTHAMMNGAMQNAGRDLTLESAGSRESDIDARVTDEIRAVVPSNATITLEKLSHFEFSDIGEPEEIIEDPDDANMVCDPGETYIDANNNGTWDADRGQEGIGGARDAVLYTAIVEYDRLFPMYGLAGMSQKATLRASTVLRNQPYDEQDLNAETRDCA